VRLGGDAQRNTAQHRFHCRWTGLSDNSNNKAYITLVKSIFLCSSSQLSGNVPVNSHVKIVNRRFGDACDVIITQSYSVIPVTIKLTPRQDF